jgi:predicted porin
MKKTLLASTAALTLVAFPGAASAQVEVSIGGFYEFEFGAAGNDDAVLATNEGNADADEFGFRSDAEIHFDIRGTTDNGLNFGAEIEMEASDQNEGDLDETWVFVSGDPWGEFRGGFTDGPTGDMNVAAPVVTPIGINDGTQADLLLTPTAGALDSIITGNNASFDTGNVVDDDDSLKIIYYTPRYSGFQLGVSYAPDPTNGNDNAQFVSDRDDNYKNEVQVGVNYEGSFQSIDILTAFTYTYGSAGDNTTNGVGGDIDDFNAIHFGLNLGWGGFTFGGGYANILEGDIPGGATTDINNDGVTEAVAISRESWGFDVGAAYGQGPWEVSLTYYYGEADGIEGIGDEAEHQSVLGGANYALGAGLEAFAGVGYTDYDGQVPGAASDNDGVWGFTGIQVSF